jgi:hypothetical protein
MKLKACTHPLNDKVVMVRSVVFRGWVLGRETSTLGILVRETWQHGPLGG